MVELAIDASKGETATFSSIGKLGVSRRSSERLYVNGTRFSSDPTELDLNFRRLVEIGKRNESRIGRSVFRGLVSDEVMRHILGNGLGNYLEVAFPVAEFTGDNSWLVYLASNKQGRSLIDSSGYMMRKTSVQEKEITSPLEKVNLAVEQGYVFNDTIAENQIDQVDLLWGDTFGWKRQEIENLRRKLNENQHRLSSQKDVWFSSVSVDRRIAGIAMAERLSIPGANGRWLDLVESTEWNVERKHAGNGLMTATLDMLNAQILSDLGGNSNRMPLIFAECNFQSRADWAGQKAGLRIPERTVEGHPAPQILAQNVLVRDGQQVEEDKLRDFTFMYLPKDVAERHYGPAQAGKMKSMIRV